MRILKQVAALWCAVLLSMSAPVLADFQKIDLAEEGDNKVVLDYSVGIEWLRLDVTAGLGMGYVGEVSGYLSEPDIALIHGLIGRLLGESFVSTTAASFTLTTEQRDTWFDLFGFTGVNESIAFARGFMTPYDPDNWQPAKNWAIGVIGDQLVYVDYDQDSYADGFGVWRYSNGGESLSSMNNPALNINNPFAPINATPDPTPVNAPMVSFATLMLLAAVRRRFV